MGTWRVVAWHAQGAYGAVYRAVRIGQEQAGPVALKISLRPWDRRFVREAELLSRLSHPCLPRLLDRGVLRHPSGAELPFFVMPWVDGTSLYDWAQQHAPSSAQVSQVLAHLARALEALHASGAVHRDVKGDNILVRRSDHLPCLIDFGSGHFQGAPRLTWQSLAPFTPEYLSPQASLFDIRLARHRDSYYTPCPADDLYALGVTAYRLVMGEYPPPMQATQDEQGSWHLSSPDPRPLLEQNPNVAPLLREQILRLLSHDAEVRGTAAQLAQALEAVADEPVPAPVPQLPPPDTRVPASTEVSSEPVRFLERVRTWTPWLALTAVAVCALLLWSAQHWHFPAPRVPSDPRQSSASHSPDAGTATVGEASPAEPHTPITPSTEKKPPAQQPLPEPRPGQPRPDKKGRCPGPRQVPINGGCWVEQLPMNAEECEANSYVPFNGKCYAPALTPLKKHQPTSSPPEAR
ncbi:MAG TPA: protein kinase [Myxococcaceae bacterium]